MTSKDRVLQILEHYNIGQSAFEKKVGISNGYINNLKGSIGATIIGKITKIYPEINPQWLMIGEGEMLKDSSSQSEETTHTGKLIPYYDIAAAAGSSYSMDMSPVTSSSGQIEIGSLLHDSEIALRIYGNSMTPNYPAGCVVGLKVHRDSFIEPGTVFVIETEDNRYLKRLYYNKDKTAFRCVSDNHRLHESGTMKGEFFYPDFEIPFDSVKRLYRATGVIKRNII